MSIAMPTVGFSIGSSTATTDQLKSKSLVDMSLDDLIKARRTEDKTANKSAQESKKKDALKQKRVSIKSPANTKSKKPTQAQKSVGMSKAKRGANTAARRGISPTPQPTAMQIEKEVKRQQRNGPGATTPQNRRGTRQSTRIRASDNRQPLSDKKTNKGNRDFEAPPKKAVDAALKAMTKFGYKPPVGMKVVISFMPKDSAELLIGNSNRRKKNQNQNQNQNQYQNQNQPLKSGRGRGGR